MSSGLMKDELMKWFSFRAGLIGECKLVVIELYCITAVVMLQFIVVMRKYRPTPVLI